MLNFPGNTAAIPNIIRTQGNNHFPAQTIHGSLSGLCMVCGFIKVGEEFVDEWADNPLSEPLSSGVGA